ncbi:helix-turn-helix domain-containing protein [Enterococcus sp. DIV0180]|uniref:helix-turn-helix domain-containing protein n=1 Tax=Enterococcus sp. DIV0180 TaxID=2774749 RepID=UPI003D2FD63A
MLFERVKELAKKRNKTLKDVALELGFSENAFYKWNKQSPKAENLQKTADYFHVSTDYLLGRTDNPYAGISSEQREMTIEEALNSVMSYDGKPVTENDREVLKRIAEAYLDGHLK